MTDAPRVLWAAFDTDEVKDRLRHMSEEFLEARALMLNEQYERFNWAMKSYPHVVHMNPAYLDEFVGDVTPLGLTKRWTRLELIERWLADTFPEDSYVSFSGEALGPYAHYANAVAFRDPQHAMRFKLSW